jgi:hypothetical protein
MRDGVEVFKLQKKDESEEKQVLGKSPKAGQMAVMQSAASRVFTNMYVEPLRALSFFFPMPHQEGDMKRRKKRRGRTNADDSPTLIIPPMLMTILQKRGTFVGPRGPLMSSITQLSLSELYFPFRYQSWRKSRIIPRSIPTTRYRLLPPEGWDWS